MYLYSIHVWRIISSKHPYYTRAGCVHVCSMYVCTWILCETYCIVWYQGRMHTYLRIHVLFTYMCVHAFYIDARITYMHAFTYMYPHFSKLTTRNHPFFKNSGANAKYTYKVLYTYTHQICIHTRNVQGTYENANICSSHAHTRTTRTAHTPETSARTDSSRMCIN